MRFSFGEAAVAAGKDVEGGDAAGIGGVTGIEGLPELLFFLTDGECPDGEHEEPEENEERVLEDEDEAGRFD